MNQELPSSVKIHLSTTVMRNIAVREGSLHKNPPLMTISSIYH
jgi:hypothetical protein